MKHNKTGKLSFLCAAALAAAMLAGCSESSRTQSGVDSSVKQTTTAQTTTTSATTQQDSSSQAQEETGTPSDITPAMWEVTSPDGNKMIMAGSMHAMSDEDFPLPNKITEAYKNADVLAVECDVVSYNKDIMKQLALAKEMIYDDGSTLSSILSEDAYNAVKAYIESFGQNINAYEIYKPWALSSVMDGLALNSSKLDANKGFDSYLLNQALSDGKEIYEVESVDFQMDLLMNLPVETYDALFCGYTNITKDTQIKLLDETYEAWKTGDVKTMEKLNSVTEDENGYDFSQEQIDLILDYNKQLVDDRNVGMEKAVKDLLDEGKNVFYVVGEAHFLGDTGIVAMLEKDGFTVERIEY